jgi:lipid II:glycine glycyltransferase (peptidoglycan interpeptide bridge formation enzyme)
MNVDAALLSQPLLGSVIAPTARRDPRFDGPQRAEQPVRAVEIQDRDQWDALVAGQSNHQIEQSWGWGEVQRDAGWIPHRYAAFRGQMCVGTLSFSRRQLGGGPYSVLYASRGPLVAWTDSATCRTLFAVARAVAGDCRAIFFRVSPAVPVGDTSAADVLAQEGFRALPDDWTTWNVPRVTLSMALNAAEDVLFRRLRRRIRQNITSASRRGLRVRLTDDRQDLNGFHRLLIDMGREKRYPVRRIGRLQSLWDAFVARGTGILVLVERDGALLAGLMGTRLGARASLQCAAVARDLENLPHGPLAYWAFIQWAKTGSCGSIDFGGSATQFPPRETDAGYGVYRFKSGFGAELQYAMPYHDLIFHPRLYQLVRVAERSILPKAWRLRAWLNC